jgi:CheY-like chemotaxis protein
MMGVEQKTRILAVDDNPVNLKWIEKILEGEGYHIHSAQDGLDCLDSIHGIRPELILLDINMPGMSGLEVCRALKQDEQVKDIPIIFVTAKTDDQTLREAFESGGVDYVRKPVNSVELIARVKSVLSHRALVKRTIEEEKLKGVLETAGAVCHEMNQPLQVIASYAQLMMMEVAKGQNIYNHADRIVGQVQRMGEITRKLMHITKYETKTYLAGENIIDIDRASHP